MPTIDGIDYPDTFNGVTFLAGQNQSQARKTEYADEVIVGGAVTGTSYVYRDWYANPPDTWDGDLLLPNRAAFEDLAALRGYPVDSGGVAYELSIPAQGIDWSASLDDLSSNGAYLDSPLKCHATFTRIANLVAPSTPPTQAPTAGYVAGTSGLDAEFDANQGSASSDDTLDSADWEFGDTDTLHQDGPWSISGAEIPVVTHTYAAPGDYIVTLSVVRNGVRSDDFSTVVSVS